MSAIEVRSLELGFDGHPPIFRSLELLVEKGQKVALLGPNGGGKSTLLKALAGVLTPSSGSIRILGKPPSLARQSINYLSQSVGFDQNFPITLREFVSLGTLPRRRWWRWWSPEDGKRVDRVMTGLKLEKLAEKPISQLSGGQLQRGLLARALVREAEVFLFDEPFSAIDQENRALAWAALERLVEEGATLLFVTHDPEDCVHCDLSFRVEQGSVFEEVA